MLHVALEWTIHNFGLIFFSPETNSEQNNCFEYEYEAEVLNTVPGTRVDSAGIKLKSNVKVGNVNLQEKFLTVRQLA